MKLRLFVILPLLAAPGCSQREEEPSLQRETMHASLEESTKTGLDADRQVLWSAGDRIAVLDSGGGPAEYILDGPGGLPYGDFTRKSPGALASQGPYHAVYPFNSEVSRTAGGGLLVPLSSRQEYARGSFGPGAGAMAAVSDSRELSFRNLCGALVLRFHGAGAVQSLTLTAAGGEILGGTALVRWKDGIPQLEMLSEGGSGSVELVCDPPVPLGAGADAPAEFCFALPPGVLEKGFRLTAVDELGRSTVVESARPLVIVRRKLSTMAPLLLDFTSPTEIREGKVLPPWQPGYLDIHSINGGRGEAFYYIMPDGTTMLCDAAGAPPSEIYEYDGAAGVPSRPNLDLTSGSVIINYIRHFAPSIAGGRLDYFLTSHYHGDHIGAWRNDYLAFGWLPYSKNGARVSAANLDTGGFIANGLAAVGLEIAINKVFDRGDWASRPSADYFTTSGKRRYKNYVNFLDWSARANGTVRETLDVGSAEQMVMLHNPGGYGDFSIRTIASGGDIWTGSGNGVNTSYVPSAEECAAKHEEWNINENIFSNVILLSYGPFDFFSGGDIQYTGRSTYAWKDIEKPISQVVGKVEVMKACHHSTSNTNSAALLGALKPDVYIAGVWREVQPNPATLRRVLSANPAVKIFTTNLADSNVATLKDGGVDPTSFCSSGGHVVVRVLPGGASYYVCVLDDSDMEYRVSAIFGPFAAGK